ncbi:MAG TPA: putative lipid II flippase FtsW [archaeon]|nr:putative lipid II flippase FtsW [archaeon]
MTRKQKEAVAYGNRLVLVSLLLSLAGLVMILSATSISAQVEQLSSYAYLQKHAIRVLLGLVVMWIASRLDYHFMRRISFVALMATAVLLVICLLPGTKSIAPVISGARRWVHIGILSFQPSELAKFFLICWAAGYLVRKREIIHKFSRGFLPFIFFAGIFFLMVLKEPDLSTAFVIMLLVSLTGYLGGIKLAHLIVLALLLLPYATYKYVVKVNYRNERITSYLEGEGDKSGVGYQAYQSKLALGSGGLSGVGLGKSKQKYFFLPAAHTDFIFSILGEELGFLGTTVVVLAFFYLTMLGVGIAKSAPDYFGFILASGLTLMIFISALLHMAVVSGLTPTTGMPLPFFSYGGTNLVTTFWSVGILNNISRQGQRVENG